MSAWHSHRGRRQGTARDHCTKERWLLHQVTFPLLNLCEVQRKNAIKYVICNLNCDIQFLHDNCLGNILIYMVFPYVEIADNSVSFLYNLIIESHPFWSQRSLIHMQSKPWAWHNMHLLLFSTYCRDDRNAALLSWCIMAALVINSPALTGVSEFMHHADASGVYQSRHYASCQQRA